uniref:Uncharacterized protein n=1 Tax=Panagrolaimus superbus TaxID=310955 RepID=A0A914XSP6_9BILA
MRPHRGRRRILLSKNNSFQSDHVTPTTATTITTASHCPQLPYYNNSSKICLNFSKKYYYSFAHVIFGVLLLVINFSSCSCRGLNNPNSDRPDFVCNNDGSHKCVCNRFSGNLDKEVTECTQFLGVPSVPAIKIILHKVNLEAHLHTNETYQQYFRRRIANLISQFCERQAHECPGTPLRIPKVETETTTKLFLDDEYEPPITQDNVVILRVNFLDHDQTELYFVVTKDSRVQILSQDTLMEPSKIKLILSAQIGPLSRVLGGVHIHELELGEVHRIATLDNDNSKAIKIIIVIAVILGIIYIIAINKCLK